MGFSEAHGELPAPNANAVPLFAVAASASVASSLEEAFLRAPSLIAPPAMCRQSVRSRARQRFGMRRPVAVCRELLMVAACLLPRFSAWVLSTGALVFQLQPTQVCALSESRRPTAGTQASSRAASGLRGWGGLGRPAVSALLTKEAKSAWHRVR